MYDLEIQNILLSGYAEPVPIDTQSNGRCFYFPHYAVTNKANKIAS